MNKDRNQAFYYLVGKIQMGMPNENLDVLHDMYDRVIALETFLEEAKEETKQGACYG